MFGTTNRIFVERRQRRLEEFLNRIMAHPVLSTIKYVTTFIEAENFGDVKAMCERCRATQQSREFGVVTSPTQRISYKLSSSQKKRDLKVSQK